MCGIVGAVFSLETSIGELLYRGLKRLEYRGYDSAGVAVVSGGVLRVLKGRGKIDELAPRLGFRAVRGVVGIAHTRWATHGAPTDTNAHPHVDCSGEIAVVHNGIIENYAELKRELAERGHVFRSETDTEVFAHLMEEYLGETGDLYLAFKKSVSRLRGTYAILALSAKDPGRIFFAKKDSPLVVGLGDGFNVVASDIPALLDYTRRILVLRDHWVGYVSNDLVHVENLLTGERVDYLHYVRYIDWSLESAEKGGYAHFMEKEIYEQPVAIAQTFHGLMSDETIEKVADTLLGAESIYITGAGTSYHASEFFALAYMKLVGEPVTPFIASEYQVYSRAAGRGDALIVVSQSGETMDSLRAMRAFKERGVKTIALSNVVDSAIPRESDVAIYTRAGPEIGVAATKTFTTQTLVLGLLAVKAAFKAGLVNQEEYDRVLGEAEKIGEVAGGILADLGGRVRELARDLSRSARSMYFLSRGIGVPVAKEGALKVKEVSYIHAEAYPAGESKHGPIALVEEGFPVVFVIPPDREVEEAIGSNVEEMVARGARTICLLPHGATLTSCRDVFEIPRAHWVFTPILYTPLLQLLAYHAAVERGLDPDKPRNLAKTVTVL